MLQMTEVKEILEKVFKNAGGDYAECLTVQIQRDDDFIFIQVGELINLYAIDEDLYKLTEWKVSGGLHDPDDAHEETLIDTGLLNQCIKKIFEMYHETIIFNALHYAGHLQDEVLDGRPAQALNDLSKSEEIAAANGLDKLTTFLEDLPEDTSIKAVTKGDDYEI